MEGDNIEDLSLSPKKGRGEKHVSFPPDEEIVSGFNENKDSLKNDGCRSLLDVILAYEQSCAKHQVEPNQKLLDQLKQVSSVKGRAGCLDLKGERLDYRSCESLEEVLKSVQYDFINLQETELEENGASSLLDMILYYESAAHLNISSNTKMGISGWQALSRLLRQSGCLWRLDACNVPVVEYPVQALSKALLTSRLTVLNLENTCLSGRPLFTLVGSLRKNTMLQDLCLANNQLNSYQDSVQLGDLLQSSRSLRSLDLRSNLIADAGLEEIREALNARKSGLRSLLLCNNQITHSGMTSLANILPCLNSLETLDLGQNPLQNPGVHGLKEALMMNRSILHLGLADTQISCEGAVALAEFIAESRQIQRLDIRRNCVLVGGLLAFSLALGINCSLIRLDLDQNSEQEKEEEGTGPSVRADVTSRRQRL
ncbi:protein phosphatase 1 regulatory subunit 37 isoform X2 [Denticeps clupeoides]|uniref:protein phosphatase 1 regulatory subunit 37 isoform X2 n=1 Tax=Denticeps clupeoides TaxID=299321 RepID=UPI0010A4F58E|nr:protein phosphatase 1 regulatory subunit 37-like isoform X2 [Denticeps clupeoides]